MTLNLNDCAFFGPALPEPFVKLELEKHLRERQLLPSAEVAEGRALQERWETYWRKLRALGEQGGNLRVASHVLAPLVERLGYGVFERQDEVATREGLEDGGWLMRGADSVLRCWSVDLGTDLDAPNLRGRAYRFSSARVAQRVLLSQGERVGLLTDGEELRILICDPARPDSHIAIRLDRSNGWRAAHQAPDSYRLLLALASPSGTKALPELTEAARLAQTTVTRKLRVQARRAIESFIQSVLDQPANAHVWTTIDATELAQTLWREGLVLVYRLLFIFKLESSADPARAFSFAATSLWRNTYSPNLALAPLVRKVLDEGAETGGLLEEGLRNLWKLFAKGLSSRELQVSALGGMLFGEGTTPQLDCLHWGETAVAKLLDMLLWTLSERQGERERVHYGALDVEDLGRVYEALLELEPGITAEPMCRLRRAKLEVVVPAAQGEPYRSSSTVEAAAEEEGSDSDEDTEEDEEEEEESPRRRSNTRAKTKVHFIESIPTGRFFLRVGLGRKASGSYYTPHPFVLFLVQETLGPQVTERSPQDDPQPGSILDLKILDPAMGSGHFLVEACRFLGEALYEACRLCDELALQAEGQAERSSGRSERARLLDHARNLRKRVENLPDPDNELLVYLPSRILEGQESGPSQRKALALCRRLVAVHCLYGVDKNPLAVELAKLSLWLESYAEGLPLTFLDHRLICGDSLTGSFSEHLFTYPRTREEIRGLFVQGLTARLEEDLASALAYVQDLEASVGKDLSDLARKRKANEQLESALRPFRLLAAAWAGGIMLGNDADDAAYVELLQAIVEHRDTQFLEDNPTLKSMVRKGAGGVCYDLVFPEIFHPAGNPKKLGGFHAILGNPPWDTIRPLTKEFFASFDLDILNAPTKRERELIERRVINNSAIGQLYSEYITGIDYQRHMLSQLYIFQRSVIEGRPTGGDPDLAKYFAERVLQLSRSGGVIGVVLPAAIHVASGAAALRKLYLDNADWKILYSFHNALSLFEVETKVKFSLIVVKCSETPGNSIRCRFRQKKFEGLSDSSRDLIFSREFIHLMGGPYLTFPELESQFSVNTLRTINANSTILAEHCRCSGILFGSELHATSDSWRVMPTRSVVGKDDPRNSHLLERLVSKGFLIVANEDSIHQYDDHWKEPPRYLASLEKLGNKDGWVRAAQHFRLFYRRIANVVDLRSFKAALVPPGWLSASPFVNRTPWLAPNAQQLILLAILNSYCLDWSLRLRLSATLNKFIIETLPVPNLEPSARKLLCHGSLRLSCNHAGYTHLWREQVGEAWRERGPLLSWPVIETKAERWEIRAAIDAVVAQSYKLSREQYAHVLGTFSHKAHTAAPELCLAAFDELRAIGLEAFTKRHDPYWDIPLSNELPKPVIDLPVFGKPERAAQDRELLFAWSGEPAKEEPSLAPAPAVQSEWMSRTPIDRHVLVLAQIVDAHQRADRLATLGNVKAEKVVYLIEAHAGVNFDRTPIREAAGPADFPRLKKVIHRGEKLHVFSVRSGPGGAGFIWSPGGGLRKRLKEYEHVFATEAQEINRVIDLLVPMDSQQAEIVATLYACWNDLLARGNRPDDHTIIEEFYSWSEGKRRFEVTRLEKALDWMRKHALVPTGRAKTTLSIQQKPRQQRKNSSAGHRADDSVYATIVGLLRERDVITSSDVQQVTGLDAAEIRPYLEGLVAKGLAMKEGQRRGTKYRRIES